jgi:hypothetical protein
MFPIKLIAQGNSKTVKNKDQSKKQLVLQNRLIKSTTKLQGQLSKAAEIYKKIPVLEKILLRAKTALLEEQNARVGSDKRIVLLTANMKSIKSKLDQRDSKVTLLLNKIKALEDKASKSNTEIVSLIETNKKLNEGDKSKKIAALEEMLSFTKAERLKDATELVELQKEIKSLESIVGERDTELSRIKDEYNKSTKAKLYKEVMVLDNVVTCYRKALINWDNTLQRQGLTDRDRLTIRAELRSQISICPPI